MNIEELILKLDGYFANKKPSEIKMVFIATFFIIFYVAYMSLYDISDEYCRQNIINKENLEKSYLELPTPKYLDEVISKKQKELEDSLVQLKALKANNNFLNTELKKLSTSFFDINNQNLFLNYISKQAEQNSINITNITNNTKPLLQLFTMDKIYDFRITFSSSFTNLLKYINSLEELNLVIDINNIDLNASSLSIIGNMDISTWGIKYQ